MGTFAAAGDRDLTVFEDQWLHRTGAPTLSLGEVEFKDDKVKVKVEQLAPIYDLEVPVVVTTAKGDTEHIVRLTGESDEFTIKGQGIRQVSIDPDYHLFRRLHRQEIEATITQVLADEEPAFVMGAAATPMMQAAGQAFAAGFVEDDSVTVQTDGQLVAGGQANVIMNPDAALLKQLAPKDLKIAGSMIFLGGKRYERAKFDLVFAAADPNDPTVTDLVLLCDSPQRLEGLANRVSHYGKYSWLMLPVGSGRPDRGNWQPGESPLTAFKTAKK